LQKPNGTNAIAGRATEPATGNMETARVVVTKGPMSTVKLLHRRDQMYIGPSLHEIHIESGSTTRHFVIGPPIDPMMPGPINPLSPAARATAM
jgi:hypothetical protein